MFDHVNWANQRILEALQGSKENQEITRLFSHILLAEKVWITRLQGKDSSQLPIWLEIDVEGCAELVKENEERYKSFLTPLTNEDLDNVIAYRNSKGTEFKNSVREILTHTALHGHYHRGQINSKLRACGLEPINIDFITYVR
ncbi:MAG TPA: DinB family protein [Niallia sp.]|nr:DinB family protein [Niallia sp.]